MCRADVIPVKGSLAFGPPEKLWSSGTYLDTDPGRSWDVGPDGRFVMLKREASVERWKKLALDRIVVDTGGVAHLLAERKGEK